MDDLKQRLRDAIVADAFGDGRILSGPLAERLILERREAAAALDAKDAEIARLRDALGKLHHAVCGETGFAAAVRQDSGKAYPWPALDEADAMATAALTAGRGD